MPQPRGQRPSPDDLARQIARRLAESGTPSRTRFSLRGSVFVGRLFSGLTVLGTAAITVLGIFAGVDWILDENPNVEPQVLSAEINFGADATDLTGPAVVTAPAVHLGSVLGTVISEESVGPVATTVAGFTIGVSVPPATTPASPAPSGVNSSTTTQRPPATSPVVTTTQPSTPATSPGPTTSSPTSTTSPVPTVPATTTTTAPPTTVTTTAPTTTTTLIEETTTTCGNNGSGKGNCG